ncbi:MAG: FAD-dependent thymidylate synthase [Desulfurococcales archaeon]|nr:FAD-dependent thymidylate synthase [Desulfurococcales archaeon]
MTLRVGLSIDLGVRVVLLSYTVDGERLVAASSKVSLSRKPVGDILSIGEGEVEEWIRETFKRQHFSPWEHSTYTFLVDGLSRVASHQLVRHRIASYTQQSHRYTEGYLRDMALEASRITGLGCPGKPKGRTMEAYKCYSEALHRASEEARDEEVIQVGWKGYVPPPRITGRGLLAEYYRGMLKATGDYYKLLSKGIPREDARYVVPQSVRTRIVVSMNARELVQSFLPLRMCTKAQWEIRRIAWLLWRELVKTHPRLFKWAGPSCVYRENTGRREPATLQEYLEGSQEFTIPRCPEQIENKAIPKCLKTASKT